MPSTSPPFAHGRPVRRRLAGLAVAASLVTGGGFVAALPAAADVAQQIRDTQARIDALNTKAEAAAERFNAGRIALAGAQRDETAAQDRLAREQAALADLGKQAGAFGAQAYMTGLGGQGLQILASSDPTEVLGQLGTLDRISRSQADLMARLATARHRRAAAAADAHDAVARAVATVTLLREDKQSVVAAGSQAQVLLKQLQVKQTQIVKAAIDAAARRAAQARQAALAEQARQAAAALAAFRAQPVAVEQPVVVSRHVRRVVRDAPAVPAAPAPPVAPVAPAAPPAPPAPAPSGNAAQVAVRVAMSELGKSYVWGAAGPDHFDCSGLTMYAYAAAGVSLSHFTGAQWNEGRHVPESDLQPGDLVFFEKTLGHMGMYIGNGQFIHAPHTGDVVKISALSGYYQDEYAGAVRVAG